MEDAQSVADFGGKFCLVVGPGKVMVDGEAYNMFKSLNLFQWIASEVNSDDCDVPYSAIRSGKDLRLCRFCQVTILRSHF